MQPKSVAGRQSVVVGERREERGERREDEHLE